MQRFFSSRIALAVAFVTMVGCGGNFESSSNANLDGGPSAGSAGVGGAASGGYGSGGKVGSGGAHVGGASGHTSTGGASVGGSAGSPNDAGACPPSAPAIGSACPPGVECIYGNICCGGGYVCSSNGTWSILPVGCACPPPPPSDAGVVPCGSASCAPNEVCVHPANNFCGPQPLCVPVLDGGACPPGTTWMQYCGGSSSGGCVDVPKPVPPHCAPMPSSCGSAPTCACLPGICGSSVDVCNGVAGRDVSCLCIAP